ncbi:MAG TPA: PIN domain-containing protein [Methylocystis sp.]|nr:PIN domain-containing protein [Methylocystis sp.]HXZ15330.1 PIN domain-containing protein [Roseiarcus sp.]
MRTQFCLDASVVIFALNKRKPWINHRLTSELQAGSSLVVPVVVLFELQYGIANSGSPPRARAILENFLAAGFDTPTFDEEDAREAGEIRAYLERQGTPIGPYDVLIAAQARRRGAALVTLNRREFERVPGLIVTDWGGAEGPP